MGVFRGVDSDEGWVMRRFKSVERDLDELAAAKRLVFSSTYRQADNNSLNLTTGFVEYLLTSIPVPTGYSYAIVNLFVSAGATVAGALDVANSGNIGVVPVVAGTLGPALSNGRTGGGPMSVNSGFATKVAVGTSLSVSLQAYANSTGAGITAGSGNVHLAATVIFSRS